MAETKAELINVEQAAAILGVARITIYSYVDRGQLPRHASPQGARFFLLDKREVEHFKHTKVWRRRAGT